MSNFLFILRKAPYAGAHALEMLDVVLTTAAFDQHVSLLLLDDGVFQLKESLNKSASGLKDPAPIFKALAIYDVDGVFAETESLEERGLIAEQLCVPVRQVLRKDVHAFMQGFDKIISG